MNRRHTVLGLVTLFAVLSLVVVPVVAGVALMSGMPMHAWGWTGPMHDSSGLGIAPLFALAGIFAQLAVFALLAAGGYLVYRAATRDRPEPALEALRRAYARGDIDDDEYDRRREKLDRTDRHRETDDAGDRHRETDDAGDRHDESDGD